VAQRVTRNKD